MTLLVGALVCQLLSAPKAGQSLEIEKFGYQLRVPKNWNVDLPSSGVPFIFNYSRGDGLPQDLLPEHGAMIYCAPDLAVTVPGIPGVSAGRIARGSESNRKIVSSMTLPELHKGSQFPRDLVRVVSDIDRYESKDFIQREVRYAFTLRELRLSLVLTYWKGDRQAARYESVAREILESIAGR